MHQLQLALAHLLLVVSLEAALPAEVCLERAAVVQVHWSCDVSWYFFNKGVWATGFSRNVWNMGGCFLHCVIAVWKMPHTTGKPWVRQLVWWQQCFIREHRGSYKQQLWRSWGAAWISECGHFMHTELLYAYPHRMMLEDGKIIARCSENQKSKLRLWQQRFNVGIIFSDNIDSWYLLITDGAHRRTSCNWHWRIFC